MNHNMQKSLMSAIKTWSRMRTGNKTLEGCSREQPDRELLPNARPATCQHSALNEDNEATEADGLKSLWAIQTRQSHFKWCTWGLAKLLFLSPMCCTSMGPASSSSLPSSQYIVSWHVDWQATYSLIMCHIQYGLSSMLYQELCSMLFFMFNTTYLVWYAI